VTGWRLLTDLAQDLLSASALLGRSTLCMGSSRAAEHRVWMCAARIRGLPADGRDGLAGFLEHWRHGPSTRKI
jgi:hypothetical protein